MSDLPGGLLTGLGGLLLVLASCGGPARSASRTADPTVESAGAAGALAGDPASGGAEAICDEIPVVDASCSDEGLRCGPYSEHLACTPGEVPFNSYRVCVKHRWTRADELHSGCSL